jgi:thiol-disulfide isomerase/thioredoxin
MNRITMNRILCLASMLTAALLAAPADAAAAPRLNIASSALTVPEHPYDENLAAAKAVDAAFARARKTGKRVMIVMGGNWCPDCRILAGIMALPAMKGFLAAHFEIVAVDIGRFDKNLDVPARFGITGRLAGVPAILVAAPDGTLVNRSAVTAFADARSMAPQAIADRLAAWAK